MRNPDAPSRFNPFLAFGQANFGPAIRDASGRLTDVGLSVALGALTEYWRVQTGQDPSAALIAEWRNFLSTAPSDVRSVVGAIVENEMGGTSFQGAPPPELFLNAGTRLIGAVPPLGDIFDNAMQAAGFEAPSRRGGRRGGGGGVAVPRKSPEEIARESLKQSRIDTFTNLFGRTPTAAEEAQFLGLSEIDFKKWLEARPYKEGLTYGQYQERETARQGLIRSRIETFTNVFGRTPTADEEAQFAGLSEADFQKWLDARPYKAGLSYGAYRDTYDKWDKTYVSIFGRHINDDEVRWAAGKADDQVAEHINQSPSRIPGLTVSEFFGYKKHLDGLMNEFYGHEAPDELIADFHRTGLK